MWEVPLLTTLASSAYDWFRSGTQQDRINQLEKDNVRPDMPIPEANTKALATAKLLASQKRLPGQSAIEGRLDRTTADQVALLERSGTGGTTMINGASRAYGNQQDQETKLGVAAADNYNRNQGQYINELNDYGDKEQRQWDWNVGSPYLSKQKAIAALKEAQIRNENTSVKNLIGGLGNTALLAGMGGDDKFISPTHTGESSWFTGAPNPTNSTEFNNNNPNQYQYKNYSDKLVDGGWGWH